MYQLNVIFKLVGFSFSVIYTGDLQIADLVYIYIGGSQRNAKHCPFWGWYIIELQNIKPKTNNAYSRAFVVDWSIFSFVWFTFDSQIWLSLPVFCSSDSGCRSNSSQLLSHLLIFVSCLRLLHLAVHMFLEIHGMNPYVASTVPHKLFCHQVPTPKTQNKNNDQFLGQTLQCWKACIGFDQDSEPGDP